MILLFSSEFLLSFDNNDFGRGNRIMHLLAVVCSIWRSQPDLRAFLRTIASLASESILVD